MCKDIESIKRKLLIKYPNFGSIISRLEFKENDEIDTAATDGKVIIYNQKFLEGLSEKQKIFLFAHEVCHIGFDHIFRREGKDGKLWNIATDAVINALLKQDGLEMIEGSVDIPEAENFNAEDLYEKLLNEQKKQQESSNGDSKEQEGSSGGNEKQNNSNSQGQKSEGEEQQGSLNSDNKGQENQGNQKVGYDSHDLWDKAIEDRKKEEMEGKSEKSDKPKEKIDERKEIEKNREERKRRLKEFSKQLADRS